MRSSEGCTGRVLLGLCALGTLPVVLASGAHANDFRDILFLGLKDPLSNMFGVSLLLLEALLVVWLFISRNRHKRVEKQLLDANAALEHSVLERAEELQQAMVDLHDVKADLGQLGMQFDQFSRTDLLTGLYNRRYAEERIVEEFSRFQRYGTLFSIMLTNVDSYREVLGAHGPETGDLLLQGVARELAAAVRPYDIASRWTNEAFLLLLPNTEADAALGVAERIRAHIAAQDFPSGGGTLKAVMSCGVSTAHSGDTLLDVVKRADAALYEGKESCSDGVTRS